MTVFDYIVKNDLPLSMEKSGKYIIVNCHAWDIEEIDDFVLIFKGIRIGFDVKINMENVCQKQSQ